MGRSAQPCASKREIRFFRISLGQLLVLMVHLFVVVRMAVGHGLMFMLV